MATSQQPTESCDVDQLPDPTKTKPSSFFSHPRNHQRLELSNKSDQRKSRIHTRTHLPVRGTNASIKRLPQIHPSNQPNTASSTQNLQAPAGKNGAGGSTLTSAEPPNHPAAASGLSRLQNRWNTRDEAAVAGVSSTSTGAEEETRGGGGISIADLRKPWGVGKWNQRRMEHPPPRREEGEERRGEDSRPWNSQGHCAGVFYSHPQARRGFLLPPFWFMLPAASRSLDGEGGRARDGTN